MSTCSDQPSDRDGLECVVTPDLWELRRAQLREAFTHRALTKKQPPADDTCHSPQWRLTTCEVTP